MEGSEATGAPRIMVVAALGRRDIVSMFDLLVGQAELTFVEYARNWGHGLDPAAYEGYWSSDDLGGAQLAPMLCWIPCAPLAWRCCQSARETSLHCAQPPDDAESLSTMSSTATACPRPFDRIPRSQGPRRSGPRSTVRANRFFLDSTIREGFPGAVRLAEVGFRATVDGGAVAHPRLARARRPDRYVSFSEECFEYHRVADRVPVELANRTVFVGVPQFDCFAYKGSAPKEDRLAVMADHQLHNVGMRGWTVEYRRDWARRLEQTLRASSWRLVLKRHPGDMEDVWRDSDPAFIEQVETIDELAAHADAASLVLGTGSTLQLPLMASPGAAALALEIHPRPGPALSGRIIEAGVAEAVLQL